MTKILHTLSLDDFLTLAHTAKRVAVFHEIPLTHLSPVALFKALDAKGRHGAIFETGLHETDGRALSYLAFDPIATLQAKNGVMTQTIVGKTVTTLHTNPFKQLNELTGTFSCVTREDMNESITKALGFITYDAVRYIEAIPDRHTEAAALPDILFHFYRVTLLVNHQKQTVVISIVVEVDQAPQQVYQAAQQEIAKMVEIIHSIPLATLSPTTSSNTHPSVSTDVSDEKFMQLVEKAKIYIKQGDAFQIVLSRRFSQPYHVSPLAIYHTLRQISRAPYLFYLATEQCHLIGASPEALVRVHQQEVMINPIAGTRRRSPDRSPEEIRTELLADKKEVAEHMMLVDLARNDIGAVCEPGSIHVADLLNVRHFSHVSHITSTVTGRLRQHIDNLTALTAAFPAGTLSGAPKIRAMEIIDELETSRRGLYGGAICRLDLQHNLDSCIAIRMAVLKDGIATVRAGAGIVYDSNPAAEAHETRHKAQALLDAIAKAEEMSP